MRVCEYCGGRNPEEEDFCSGCGTSLINSSRSAASSQPTTEAPVRRRSAVSLALTAMWAPFVLCAVLSGVWKYLLMLPGVFLVVLLHGHGRASQWAAYLISAGLTLLIIAVALPVQIRGTKAFKWWLGSFLAAFCALAFVTLLMLRA